MKKDDINNIPYYDEEENIDIATKEQEIMNFYSDDNKEFEDSMIDSSYEIDAETEELDHDEYADYGEDKYIKREKRIKRIINIVFAIIIVLLILITIDVVCVAKYDKGPFFAIPTYTYQDGGTKEYYGIGYKVIKYNQIQGRRDRQLGTWSLKYDTNAITIQDIDLAIEMRENEANTYKKYHKKFVRIISTLQKVDEKNHRILLGYQDEEGKYSLDIVCDIVKDQKNLSKLEEGKEITIIGTINDFKGKKKKTNRKLYISHCFAEQ